MKRCSKCNHVFGDNAYLFCPYCGVELQAVDPLDDVKRAAEQGDSEAQYKLGCCYDSGNGVKIDPQEAMSWWTKAAKQNNPKAQYELGEYYSLGHQVEKDENKAQEYWIKAAQGCR